MAFRNNLILEQFPLRGGYRQCLQREAEVNPPQHEDANHQGDPLLPKPRPQPSRLPGVLRGQALPGAQSQRPLQPGQRAECGE